jgi:hypothetical protein
MGVSWYHCSECREKFIVRVGTLYERWHIALHKWLLATHLLCASAPIPAWAHMALSRTLTLIPNHIAPSPCLG